MKYTKGMHIYIDIVFESNDIDENDYETELKIDEDFEKVMDKVKETLELDKNITVYNYGAE